MTTVERTGLPVGALLAEGGEGRVHELVGRPGELYKAYRRPVPIERVAPLLAWRQRLDGVDGAMAARVAASTSWPSASVLDPAGQGGTVSGLVIPRAPGRFSLRHRDGVAHLATLSYLTADPGQRAAAYGVELPAAASASRVALVYALARLLEAFAAGPTILGHGDLSTKNVLWSLQPAPEIYLLDCDSSRLFDGTGAPLDVTQHRQVATPNWEDPAVVVTGRDPGPLSDRYSLALIFLRVVGAGHYPIQARQKRGEHLAIDVEIPPWGRRSQRLSRDAPVWELCGRGLSVVHPDDRPDATEWVEALEATLDAVDGADLAGAVRAAQGDLRQLRGAHEPRRPAGAAPSSPEGREVVVRAVTAEVRAPQWASAPTRPTRPPPSTAGPFTPSPSTVGPSSSRSTYRPAGAPTPGRSTSGVPLGTSPTAPVSGEIRRLARMAWQWWLLLHRRAGRALRSRGRRRRGLARLWLCIFTDFTIAVIGLFLVAMIASPFLGI